MQSVASEIAAKQAGAKDCTESNNLPCSRPILAEASVDKAMQDDYRCQPR